jgi:hypothetical protein
VVGYINYDPQNDTAGIYRRERVAADGLTKDAAEEILGNASVDTNWFMDAAQLTEKANGEYALVIDKTKARYEADSTRRTYYPAVGKSEAKEEVVWYALSETSAQNVYDDATNNATDMTGATYAASPASHQLLSVRQDPQANGSFNVTRWTRVPHNTASRTWPESTSTYSNDFRHPYWKRNGTNQAVSWVSWWEARKYHATLEDAHNTLGSTYNSVKPPWDIPPTGTRPGVHIIGRGMYMSVRTHIYEVTAWAQFEN